MFGNQPTKVVYIQQPIPARKKLYRSPSYLTAHNNQVLPRPIFTCIDEVYAYQHVSHPPSQKIRRISSSSIGTSKDDRPTKNGAWRKWLLIIVIIIIIACIIGIIVLLSVFLNR